MASARETGREIEQRRAEEARRAEDARVAALLESERTRGAVIDTWIKDSVVTERGRASIFRGEESSSRVEVAPNTHVDVAENPGIDSVFSNAYRSYIESQSMQLAVRNDAQVQAFFKESDDTLTKFLEAVRAQERITELEQEQAAVEARIVEQTQTSSRTSVEEYASRQARLEQLHDEQAQSAQAALVALRALNKETQRIETHLQEERALLIEQWKKTDPKTQAQAEAQLAARTDTERDAATNHKMDTHRKIELAVVGLVEGEQAVQHGVSLAVDPKTGKRVSIEEAARTAEKTRVELQTQTGADGRKNGTEIERVGERTGERDDKSDPSKPAFEDPEAELQGDILRRVKAAQIKWQIAVESSGGLGQGAEEQFRKEIGELTGRIQGLAPLSTQLSEERDRVMAVRSHRTQVEPDVASWEWNNPAIEGKSAFEPTSSPADRAYEAGLRREGIERGLFGTPQS